MDMKGEVKAFWNDASCGEKLLLESNEKEGYDAQSLERYRLEPEIESFAEFDRYFGKHVLEIGVGLGADHRRFAENGAITTGIDLTERAIEHTRTRLEHYGLRSDINLGDAEQLAFTNESFDLVYSWGVIHHSPDTSQVVKEIYRVLKSGGQAKVMIYHKWSIVGFMLWFRYGLLSFRPQITLSDIYSQQLESPGTKAYSVAEAMNLFSQFADVKITTYLTHADLLTSGAGQRHEGFLLVLARMLWPRWLLKKLFSKLGLFMLIEAKKA